jgi:HEPN domain-containing protein
MGSTLSLYRRAEKELARARAANAAVKPAWAWLAAHGAAEFAIKALRLKYQLNGHERVVGRLLLDMPSEVDVPATLRERAALLDEHYLPCRARAENGSVRVSPPPTEEAIAVAEDILSYVRQRL